MVVWTTMACITEDAWPISQISTLSPDTEVAARAEEKLLKPDTPMMPFKSKTGKFVGVMVNTTIECIGVTIDGQHVPLTSRRSSLSAFFVSLPTSFVSLNNYENALVISHP